MIDMKVIVLYNTVLVEISLVDLENITTPYVTIHNKEDKAEYYVEARAFFEEMLGIRVHSVILDDSEETNAIIINVANYVTVDILNKLPKTSIVYTQYDSLYIKLNIDL